jgi:hypothetical protein
MEPGFPAGAAQRIYDLRFLIYGFVAALDSIINRKS